MLDEPTRQSTRRAKGAKHSTGGFGESRQAPKRVLQVSYACDPDRSMESRIGWRRAVQAAESYDVTVLYGDGPDPEALDRRAASLGLRHAPRFIRVSRGPWGRQLNRFATTFYLGYRLWHRRAFSVASDIQAERPFDLAHQVTFCGYREPSDAWRLDCPFVWGPVGGTQSFPPRHLGQLGLRDAWIELCRNTINWWQIRFSRRVRCAANRAAVLVAATRRGRNDLRRTLGVNAEVHLETAIELSSPPPRRELPTDEPFRLLWSGRLRAWKALPLLLRALAELPKETDYRLRVLGEGPCEQRWRRLADRLGVAERVEWAGWPGYDEQLAHYRWAHAFAFTSMRDTSGTGLLEALAAGTPIIGVDHQGAADIMTPDCAIPVPVGSPSQTIDGFAEAIAALATDPDRWSSLSIGAIRRAGDYTWESRGEALLSWYQRAVAARAAPPT